MHGSELGERKTARGRGEGTLSAGKGKGKIKGLRESGIVFTQEENLSGPQTGEPGELSVAGYFCKQCVELNL